MLDDKRMDKRVKANIHVLLLDFTHFMDLTTYSCKGVELRCLVDRDLTARPAEVLRVTLNFGLGRILQATHSQMKEIQF
jgi:hypothetical protein